MKLFLMTLIAAAALAGSGGCQTSTGPVGGTSGDSQQQMQSALSHLYEQLNSAKDVDLNAAVSDMRQIPGYESVALASDGDTLIIPAGSGGRTFVGLHPPPGATPGVTDRVVLPDSLEHQCEAASPRTGRTKDLLGQRRGFSQMSVGSPRSNKAAILMPFASDGFAFPADAIAGLQTLGYQVTVLRDADVTLDATISILAGDYALLAVKTHGGYYEENGVPYTFLTLGESYRPDHPALAQFPPGSIASYGSIRWVHEEPGIDCNGIHSFFGRCPMFTIDSRVFLQSFRAGGTIVWAGGCKSFVRPDLANACLGASTGAFLGWTNYAQSDIENCAFGRFVQELQKQGTTAGGAWLATRWDSHVFFNVAITNSYGILNVRDLQFDSAVGGDVLGNPISSFRMPVNELGGRYRAELFDRSNGSPVPVDTNYEFSLSLNQYGEIAGAFDTIDSNDNIVASVPLLEGRIEGLNFYFAIPSGAGHRIFLGRGLPYPLGFLGLVGGQEDKVAGWFETGPLRPDGLPESFHNLTCSGADPTSHGTWAGQTRSNR